MAEETNEEIKNLRRVMVIQTALELQKRYHETGGFEYSLDHCVDEVVAYVNNATRFIDWPDLRWK